MKSADSFIKARKLKTRQQDFTDCGAACLVSVCRYYGLHVSISQVRSMAGTDQQGTSIMGLLEASKKLGFDARGVQGSRQSLFKIPKPALAHVVLKNIYQDHGPCQREIETNDLGRVLRYLERHSFDTLAIGFL